MSDGGYRRNTTKWLIAYPATAPKKTSEGKCAWSGSRVSARKVAVPYATQGTHLCRS